ncbi:MAG: sigma-70 family RNA polymerase sigma factor [Dehalococcoidia bacterium]|nr:sigma-70 family RNA polymerase sigma factor [Dehalococcoidia bacterium]
MTSGRPRARRPQREAPAAAPAGEPRAFTELYEAYAGQVYGYLRARVNSRAEAEDLAARTFANAFTHLDQYRTRGGRFGAWLMAIAHNLLANWYRERGRRPPAASLDEALELPSQLPGPETHMERNDLIRAIRTAIDQLTAEQQRLIALKYVDRLTNAEIGHMMERSEGAVKALHHRTLRKLQALLADLVDA